jgi:hypothetical protein
MFEIILLTDFEFLNILIDKFEDTPEIIMILDLLMAKITKIIMQSILQQDS